MSRMRRSYMPCGRSSGYHTISYTKSPRCSTKLKRSSTGRRASSQIMRRYALHDPCCTFWHDTNTKLSGFVSLAAGAVRVRPTRLELPRSSMNRYQYSRRGLSPAANTRHVQSESAESATIDSATMLWNATSSATCAVRRDALSPATGGRRVQINTLSGNGSPDATPCGKRSRRSGHDGDERSGKRGFHAKVAPRATASFSASRRFIGFMAPTIIDEGFELTALPRFWLARSPLVSQPTDGTLSRRRPARSSAPACLSQKLWTNHAHKLLHGGGVRAFRRSGRVGPGTGPANHRKWQDRDRLFHFLANSHQQRRGRRGSVRGRQRAPRYLRVPVMVPAALCRRICGRPGRHGQTAEPRDHTAQGQTVRPRLDPVCGCRRTEARCDSLSRGFKGQEADRLAGKANALSPRYMIGSKENDVSGFSVHEETDEHGHCGKSTDRSAAVEASGWREVATAGFRLLNRQSLLSSRRRHFPRQPSGPYLSRSDRALSVSSWA